MKKLDKKVSFYMYIVCHKDVLCVINIITIALLLQVNVVPIIAKADTIAKSELKQFKEKVRERPVDLS